MATSPPYHHTSLSAISPPYPSNAQLPQPPKRRQSDMPSSAPANKRRKASMLSTTSNASHPLRQTSFPLENTLAGTTRYSRSPSVDTMSLASGVSGVKPKRARKSKGGVKDDESMVGGQSKSVVSANSGGKVGRPRKRKATDESAEEEEEEEGGEEVALRAVHVHTKEEEAKDNLKRSVLVGHMDEEQQNRFAAWRASKLSDAVVRRIVNQTLSQSAPNQVIMDIKSIAKIYAGEIIETARKVQSQWALWDEEMNPKGRPMPAHLEEPLQGPLLPEHLVEAHRRYKAAREGGLAGQLGLWQLQSQSGVERFGSKVGGKRLFK